MFYQWIIHFQTAGFLCITLQLKLTKPKLLWSRFNSKIKQFFAHFIQNITLGEILLSVECSNFFNSAKVHRHKYALCSIPIRYANQRPRSVMSPYAMQQALLCRKCSLGLKRRCILYPSCSTFWESTTIWPENALFWLAYYFGLKDNIFYETRLTLFT